MTLIPEFENLKKAIELERQEEIEMYRQRYFEIPLQERLARRFTLYPVQVIAEEAGLGDQWILTLETNDELLRTSNFLPGQVVAFYPVSEENNRKREEMNGVVWKTKGSQLQIALRNDEVPDWVYQGKLVINQFLDETTYEAMNQILLAWSVVTDPELVYLRNVLLGLKEPHETPLPYQFFHVGLNESQNQAVQKILEAEHLAIVHGPPGTGKTTTLVQAIVQVLKHEKQVMVSAPSNTAVDVMTERLAKEGVKVLRIGHPARVTEELWPNTLEARFENHPDHKELKKLRKETEQIRARALKFKRNFGHEEREERKRLLNEAADIRKMANKLELQIMESVLAEAQVICCTPVGSTHDLLESLQVRTVFLDEAAQCLTPLALIPLMKGRRLVLAGDHWQLPPTVKSVEAGKQGLAETLFEKLIARFPNQSVMLDTQYRSHQHIMEFSSRKFYHHGLHAHASVALKKLKDSDSPLFDPVHFVDTAGCSYLEWQNPETLSYKNPEEASLVIRHIKQYLKNLSLELPVETLQKLSIGILSPYKEQVKELLVMAQNDDQLKTWKNQLVIDTIDGFQGQERDILYISLVRSNDTGEVGFLKDIRRMNVALTRAKKRLVVIGDSATLSNFGFYADFIKYIDEIGAYQSAWEFMA
jgi:superfamily I DNA and/or RNA helicase